MRHKLIDPKDWRSWFAWYPVIVYRKNAHYRVWLETIKRREPDAGSNQMWDYEFADKES